MVRSLSLEEVGERIAVARKAKGWTHQELADRVGVDLRTAQRWQRGRNPSNGKSWLPGIVRLMEIADVLDVPRSYLVEAEDAQAQLRDILGRLAELEARVAALEA